MTTKQSFTWRVENKKASVSQLFIKTLDHKFEKKSPIERIVNTNQFAFQLLLSFCSNFHTFTTV